MDSRENKCPLTRIPRKRAESDLSPLGRDEAAELLCTNLAVYGRTIAKTRAQWVVHAA
jgi:hypothetical protein